MSRKYKPSILFVFSIVATIGITNYSASLANSIHAHSINYTEQRVERPSAPLFNDLGNYHFHVSTNSSLAQRYFDQGLILAYGFNHAEAARSFREAIHLDPACAMCYWGLAYVLGPNINATMEDESVPTAYTAIQQAVALSHNATEREQAYITAMATRYVAEPVEDRAELDLAYANAMRDVAQQYPEDLDAQTIFVEALMDTMPWDYWLEDGSPKPETIEMMHTLESVLDRNPDHAGALHLYIHVVEKKRPELGIEAADRLRDLVPGAGHLVHMPSHIYIRVGRYHDAVVANQKATEADQNYITQCHAQGLYPVALVPHNHHFLLFAAVLSGQQQVALSAARHTAHLADPQLMREAGYGTLQHYYATPLYTLVKFEQWDAILAEPAPAEDLVYPTGVWHFARGMAFAAKGQVASAQQELEQLKAIAQPSVLEGVTIWNINSTTDLMEIAVEVLAGQIAAQQGNLDQAIVHLQKGVELEDALNYDEPAPWGSPVRQTLGEVLLTARHFVEAEQVYREDLITYPENGWSLHGLAQSLQAQGRTGEAAAVQTRFEIAWQQADFELIVD
jgi:tetratricopeptide (TPR) repeat protein